MSTKRHFFGAGALFDTFETLTVELPAEPSENVSEKPFSGSTGDPPVPSGDSPDGTAATVRANREGLFARFVSTVPVGGSPTGAGESPALPIFQTGSKTVRARATGANFSERASADPPVVLLGVPFACVTMHEALERIEHMIESREPHYVVTANVDFAAQAHRDVELHRIFLEAHLVLCDGTPLVWASRLLGHPVPERVAGADLVPALIERAVRKNYRLFFLGGTTEVTAQAVAGLTKKYPALAIVGHYSPAFRPLLEMDHDEIARRIHEARPDIVFVSFGCPKAEKWIAMHHQSLGVPVMIGVGATIDFLAGRVKRAPAWMQRAGLEWVFRLLQEPRRLIRRYAADFRFLATLLVAQWCRMQAHSRWDENASPAVVLKESTWQRILAPARLDAAEFRRNGACWERIAADDRDCLVDMAGVGCIDASGLGLLIWLEKRSRAHSHEMVLVEPSQAVRRALALMRLNDFFAIASDAVQARHLIERRRGQAAAVLANGSPRHLTWLGDITSANANEVWRLTSAQVRECSQGNGQSWIEDAWTDAMALWPLVEHPDSTSALSHRQDDSETFAQFHASHSSMTAPRDLTPRAFSSSSAPAVELDSIEPANPQPLRRSEFFIECSEVRFIDSAGAALMARVKRLAEEQGTALRFVGVPVNVQNVLQFARLNDLLPENGV